MNLLNIIPDIANADTNVKVMIFIAILLMIIN